VTHLIPLRKTISVRYLKLKIPITKKMCLKPLKYLKEKSQEKRNLKKSQARSNQNLLAMTVGSNMIKLMGILIARKQMIAPSSIMKTFEHVLLADNMFTKVGIVQLGRKYMKDQSALIVESVDTMLAIAKLGRN